MNNKNLNHTILQLLTENQILYRAGVGLYNAFGRNAAKAAVRGMAQGAEKAAVRGMAQDAAQVGGRALVQGAAQVGARGMEQGAGQAGKPYIDAMWGDAAQQEPGPSSQMFGGGRQQIQMPPSLPQRMPQQQPPQENPMGQLFGGRQQQSPGSMQGMFGGGAQAPQRMPFADPNSQSAPKSTQQQPPQENPMGQLFGSRQQQSPGSMQGMFGGGAQAPQSRQAPQRMPQQEPQRMPFAEPPLPDEMQTPEIPSPEMQPMEMPRGPSPQTMTSPMGGPSPQTVGAMDQINALGGETPSAEPNMFAQYAAFITQQNKDGSMMSPAQAPANVPAPQSQPLAASGGGTKIPTDTVPPPQIAPRQMQSPRGVPPAPTEAPQGYANQMGGDLTTGNWGQFDPEGPGEFSQSQNQYQDQLSPEEQESQRRQRYFRKSMQQPRQQQVYTSEATMVDIDDIDIEQLMRKKKMPDIVPAELLIRKFQSHEADDPTKPSKSSFRPIDQQVERHRAVSDRFRSNPFFSIPAQANIALNFPNVTRGRRPYIAD